MFKYEIDVVFKMNKYGVQTTQHITVNTDQTADEYMDEFTEQVEYELVSYEVLSTTSVVSAGAAQVTVIDTVK
jgi:hypothetical protein